MMKHKGSSYCCRWFTLFLLAMGIVLVSPDIHTDFADNYKQMKSKGATATTITPMNTNALRTIKMLEAMGIIDANRYNVNDKNNNNNNNNNNNENNNPNNNNNNNLNNYNSNVLIANNNNNNSANSKNSNKMHISSASSNQMKMHSQQLEPLADSAATPVEEELEAPELVLEQELTEHMVSTPQSMTIMVEKPTMVKHTTTTTTSPVATTTAAPAIMEPTTTTTLSAGHTATTLATASKPRKPKTTTTTITIATSATTTHSGSSTIKFASPDNVANINVSGINAKSTMMYKQQQQQQEEKQQKHKQQQYAQQQPQHHWQLRPYESQKHHPLQQQQQLTEAQFVVANSRSERRPQKYIGNTLLGDSDADDSDSGDSGSTQATASMVVQMPERRGDDELESVTATTQTQIAINGNNKSNNNRIVDGITTPITATTTTTTTADTITITPTTIKTETPTTTQSNQFESVRILYDHKANDPTDDDDDDDLKPTKETDVQMVVVAQNEEMEVDRQYKQKFSNSYSVVNSGNTHNYAAGAQLSAHQHQQQRQQQQRSRWVRQAAAEEEPIDKCRQFNEGDAAKNEFYSPDYPNYYPKNINCTRVITAPLGQIIRLDFRNSFHIEAKEDCKFDVLEIRDGQYGFSNLLGKFCGTDFPPEITSRERYLWLHFHSDESIEYSGFTAVYEFVDRRKEAPTTDLNCTIEKRGYEGFANSSDVPEDIRETAIKNRVPLDCIWRIQVEDDWKILMKFIEFRLVKPNDCDANFLDIFPEQTVMPLRLKNFCGSAGEGMTIEANVIHIRFYAEPPAILSSFSILYTAYRDRGAACTDEEFDCEDATCISKELECNLRDNCKFRWDEEKCKKEEKEGSEHILIIMIVFGLILGGMITTFLVNCIRKIMHDQKIIREIALPHASDIYHIDSFIWDAPKTAIFVGLQNDYMSEQNWQLQQQQQQQQLQQQYQLQQQHEAYMLQQSQTTQPHPHDDGSQQLDADNGNCNGQRQISCHSQSNGDSSNSGDSAGGSGSGSACGSALNSHYGNHRGIAGGGGAYTPRKQDGNDNLYMHGLNCDNANGSCSAYTYHPNVVNFNDDEFVIVTNRNGREYPLGGCGGGGGAYPPEVVANSYGYDVTPVSTDSITSSKSSPTTATN
ncbi:uncharacterized protein LOC105216006 isoform X4 [Zeugodacus cucurbitae]|uniref:uncharacterized protein LOC105216006 isoform X4 n=1 Tax=Zeugodacus cucurbitae TaxID=28588 RepID=UPI0023D95866|nr:uncharacterized protein LOC105216006 isoform X4 [Zeugodacus cucurbitae]